MDRKKTKAVAEDVLRNLDLFRGIDKGYYLNTNDAFTLPADVSIEDGVGQIVDVLTEKCSVCALGAAMLSYLRLFNGFTLQQIISDKSLDMHEIRLADDYPDQIGIKLRDIFGMEQMHMIESAFELKDCRYWSSSSLSPVVDSAAITFGHSYRSPKERLKAIMENIVANDGEFKP